MIEVSEEVKNLLKNTECKKEVVISFPNGEHEDITNDSIIAESLEFTESICSQDELEFGLCEASVLKFSAVNMPNLKNAKINLVFRIYNFNNEYAEIPMGSFIIDECKRNENNLSLRNFVAYSNDSSSGFNYEEHIEKIVNLILIYDVFYFKIPTISVDDIKRTILKETLKSEISFKNIKSSENIACFKQRYYTTSAEIQTEGNELYNLYERTTQGTITELTKSDITVNENNSLHVEDDCYFTELNILLFLKEGINNEIRYEYKYINISINNNLNVYETIKNNDGFLIYNKFEDNTIRDVFIVDNSVTDKGFLNESKIKLLKIPEDTYIYPSSKTEIYKFSAPVYIAIFGNYFRLFSSERCYQYKYNIETGEETKSEVTSMINIKKNESDVLEKYKYFELIGVVQPEIPENTDDINNSELKSAINVINASNELYSIVDSFDNFSVYINLIRISKYRKTIYFTNGGGEINCYGKIENESLVDKIGMIKCEDKSKFKDSIPEEIKAKIDSIDNNLLYTETNDNYGIKFENVYDMFELYAKIYAYNLIFLQEINIDEVLQYKKYQYGKLESIDLYSNDYKTFISPEYYSENTDESISLTNRIYTPAYSYYLNLDKKTNEKVKPPFLFSPYKIEIIENGETLYSHELEIENISDIEYGFNSLEKNGIMMEYNHDNSRYYYGYPFNYCSLPSDFSEYLEASLELNGSFGKYNRNGEFAEYKLGSDYLYPGSDVFPGDDVFPGGTGNIGNELYTKKIYKNVWYDDEPTKLYGYIICNYTNKSGEKAFLNYNFGEYEDKEYRAYDISKNKLINYMQYDESEITEIVERVANAIKNIQYMPTKLTAKGLPYVEAGDMIQIITNGETIKTYALRRTMKGIQQLTDSITAN